MKQLSKYFLTPTVPVIKVRGNINNILVNSVEKQLRQINKNTVQALAIVVNSHNGCPYETNNLANRIRAFAHDTHVPVYTFVEDRAVASGYQLLTLGSKIYAQSNSVVGQAAASYLNLNFDNALSRHGVHPIDFTTNTNLTAYATLINDKALLDTQMASLNSVVQSAVMAQRNQVDAADLQRLWIGEEAIKRGLVDEMGSCEVVSQFSFHLEVLTKLFPKARLVPLSKQSRLQAMEDNFYFILKLTQSSSFYALSIIEGFLLLIGFLLLKFIIKWTIIITMWRRMRKQQ